NVGDVDHIVSNAHIAPLLAELTQTDAASDLPVEVALETAEEAPVPSDAHRSDELGPASALTCPDCHGTLWEIEDGSQTRFRCRVGHAYSEETMIKAQGESVERGLWAALRALEERAALVEKLAKRARRRGHSAVASMFDERTKQVD